MTHDAGTEPVAWLRPDPLDCMTSERKAELSKHHGAGGRAVAAQYTVPVYTHSDDAAIARDARRYRWLRNQSPVYPSGGARFSYMWLNVAYTMHYDEVRERQGAELDAAIDAMLADEPEQPK